MPYFFSRLAFGWFSFSLISFSFLFFRSLSSVQIDNYFSLYTHARFYPLSLFLWLFVTT
ncbi:hypothetical protein BKA57DRAFT_456196 [Linnemannia elongata]|nr:hypothetical protein BKA57DRAFT_456196 [Linnemannia elongata]